MASTALCELNTVPLLPQSPVGDGEQAPVDNEERWLETFWTMGLAQSGANGKDAIAPILSAQWHTLCVDNERTNQALKRS